MAAESEQPTPPEQRQPERVGPLELLRTSKADGRALLLFSRRERDAEDGPGLATEMPGASADRATNAGAGA